MGWIRSVRPKTVLIGGFLYVVACKLNSWQGFSWLILAFILILGMAIMAGNDWDDREEDQAKGKTFAKEKGNKYLRFIFVLWVLTFIPVLYMMVVNHPFALYSAILWMISSWYSTVRSMKYIPGVYVSVIAVGAVGYPLIYNPENKDLWLFVICVLLIVYGREVIKDLLDRKYDFGHKWTIPTAFGVLPAKVVVMLCIFGGITCAAFINMITAFAFVPMIFLEFYLMNDLYKQTRVILDLMILGTFGLLLLFG